jgi:hypothetical protein
MMKLTELLNKLQDAFFMIEDYLPDDLELCLVAYRAYDDQYISIRSCGSTEEATVSLDDKTITIQRRHPRRC